MKGIILAGGSGTRLFPITKGISKQLMPIYDKPMIYYPLSILMLCGIREILIICSPFDKKSFEKLLGNGLHLGCKFEYAEQSEPRGLADAFIIGNKFVGNDKVALILGDNIFYGSGLINFLSKYKDLEGASIFAYEVKNPASYGVVEFDKDLKIKSIKEKPKNSNSNYAIPGLYFYNNKVLELAKKIKPSKRGELEITSINNEYLKNEELNVGVFRRGTTWLDTGTFETLHEASEFVRVIEKRQNKKIGCIEEVAFRMGYINKNQLKIISDGYKASGYGEYLNKILDEI